MCLFISCFAVGYLSAQPSPQTINGCLTFPDSTVRLQITEDIIYHVFPAKKRVVFITTEEKGKPNSHSIVEYILRFFDFSGNEIACLDPIRGNFIFLFAEDQQRIIAAREYGTNTSYLFDLDGKAISMLVHDDEIKDIGITSDNKYTWFASNKMRERREREKSFYPFLESFNYIPYNHVMVFDTVTGNLYGEYDVEGTQIEIEIANVKYLIKFSAADVPG
jgi:hypothetical protein